MGRPKATLEWDGSTLVRRVAGIVARCVHGPVAVVRAPGQLLPELPAGWEVVDDTGESFGPLGGLAAGLDAVGARADLVYVSSADSPLLHPAFVRRVLAGVRDGVDACVPLVDGQMQPLSAAYRTSIAPLVHELVAKGRLRASLVAEQCRSELVDASRLLEDPEVAAFDPGLDSVLNLNSPAEYQAARLRPAPPVELKVRLQAGTGRAPGQVAFTVRAWTLGSAAEAAGVPLDAGAAARLNGTWVTADPELPLVTGDLLELIGRQVLGAADPEPGGASARRLAGPGGAGHER